MVEVINGVPSMDFVQVFAIDSFGQADRAEIADTLLKQLSKVRRGTIISCTCVWESVCLFIHQCIVHPRVARLYR